MVALAPLKTPNCTTPARLTAPSRPHRRAPHPGPQSTALSAQVDCAYQEDAPKPNRVSNNPLERRFSQLRRARRRGALLRRLSAAAQRPLCPGPLDPKSTPTIRIRSDRIWTTGSRSSGRKPRVTVRPGDFVKETSTFLVINPRSSLFQK